MFGLGLGETVLIIIAILLLFGAKRLPEVAQGLGKGVREFRRAMKDTADEIKGQPEEKKPTNSSHTGTEPHN